MLCMLPPDRLRKHLELMLHHIHLLSGFCVLLLVREEKKLLLIKKM